MPEEKGVIVAVFDEKDRVAVLKRKKNWEGWELVKGHLEENYEETVIQEIKEEAGLNSELIDSIKDLQYTAEWSYKDDGDEILRKYKAYAVKVSGTPVIRTSNNPSDEHEHGFFLNPRDVKEMVEYDNNRKIIEKACKELGIDSN